MSEPERYIRQAAAVAGGDFWAVAGTVGMTVGEYEALVALFRREVEDAIRAGRVRLLERITGWKGGRS